MVIRRVGDLRAYFESQSASPEEIAETVGVSNMTIRRLLKKRPETEIPGKYWPLFDRLLPVPELALSRAGIGFEKLMEQIEGEGLRCKDASSTIREASQKAKAEKLGGGICALIRELGRSVGNARSKRTKAIALGALLYFLNPIDLIPDTVPVFGYVDDFAVLSIAASMIRSEGEDHSKSGTKTAKPVRASG